MCPPIGNDPAWDGGGLTFCVCTKSEFPQRVQHVCGNGGDTSLVASAALDVVTGMWLSIGRGGARRIPHQTMPSFNKSRQSSSAEVAWEERCECATNENESCSTKDNGELMRSALGDNTLSADAGSSKPWMLRRRRRRRSKGLEAMGTSQLLHNMPMHQRCGTCLFPSWTLLIETRPSQVAIPGDSTLASSEWHPPDVTMIISDPQQDAHPRHTIANPSRTLQQEERELICDAGTHLMGEARSMNCRSCWHRDATVLALDLHLMCTHGELAMPRCKGEVWMAREGSSWCSCSKSKIDQWRRDNSRVHGTHCSMRHVMGEDRVIAGAEIKWWAPRMQSPSICHWKALLFSSTCIIAIVEMEGGLDGAGIDIHSSDRFPWGLEEVPRRRWQGGGLANIEDISLDKWCSDPQFLCNLHSMARWCRQRLLRRWDSL